MGVAVSKISMLTHCQALTQACNYCEGQNLMLSANLHRLLLSLVCKTLSEIPVKTAVMFALTVLSFLS